MMGFRLKNSLLRQVLSFVGVLLFVLFAGLAGTLQYVHRTAENNVKNITEKLQYQINTSVEEHYDRLKNIATTVVYFPAVTNFYAKSDNERVTDMGEMRTVFANAELLDQDIEGIYLYDINQTQIAGSRTDIRTLTEGEEIIKDQISYSDICYLENSAVPYYLVYFPVYDLTNREYGQKVGMCLFLMRSDNLLQSMEELKVTEHTEIYYADGKDHILGGDGTRKEFRTLCEDEAYVVSVQTAEMGDWKVISRIPKSEIKAYKNSNFRLILLAYFLAVTVVVSLVFFLYKRILNRIRKIGMFVDEITNQPDLRIVVDSRDELGRVAASMNHMLDERDRYNRERLAAQKKMYEIELAEQQAQIMAYRNQINPHFLYNTFECIRSMALYYDMDDIAEVTMALAHIFRFAVKAGEVVSVEDEIAYVQEYARIIEYRFMGKIDICVEAEDAVRRKKVIKLLLQPIIENAVFHGLEQKVDEGEVNVSIRMKDASHIEFIIEDNGCGMNGERLKCLLAALPGKAQGGIGLTNIYHRLKLFYGEDVVFDITSSPGIGTKVTIVVPDHLEEQK